MKHICKKIYFSFLNKIIKLLIKSRIISLDIKIKELCKTKNIIYVLPFISEMDLLILRSKCLEYNLPDPFIPIKVGKYSLQRYIFILDDYQKFLLNSRNLIDSSTLINKYYQYLNKNNSLVNIKIMLISIIFGRSPKYNDLSILSCKKKFIFRNIILKLFEILWFGRDVFIYFSGPISSEYLLKKFSKNKNIINILIRLARIFFIRQRLISIGPVLTPNNSLFNKLIKSKNINKIIKNEIYNKKISSKQVEKYAFKIIKEIASDFSYEIVRLSDRILNYIWNKLYQKLNIFNIKRIYKLAKLGHEIIYVPCHRSHIDYILLSYALYHQGFSIPYIAAGINLDVWPFGLILRKLGAFFIRRTFKSNKLYSVIFSQYLYELFIKGRPVEYFIEGKRSRTGLLLKPRTGLLTITIQAVLSNINKIVTLVPVYIGYEQVLEISDYNKELLGQLNRKSILSFIIKLKRLNNLGQRYISFGNPLSLNQWLSKRFPHWHNFVRKKKLNYNRPYWLSIASNSIANYIMTNINNITVVNTTNIFSVVLLTANNCSLTKFQIINRIKFYLNLLKNVPYTNDIVIPNINPKKILFHSLLINKPNIKLNKDTVYLLKDKINIMNYYRNNIIHILIIPSLLANLILNFPGLKFLHLYHKTVILFPLLKFEFFLHYNKKDIKLVINNYIDELKSQNLIENINNRIYPIKSNIDILKSLSINIDTILQRYTIIFSLLNNNPKLDHNILKKRSFLLIKKIFFSFQENKNLELLDRNLISNLILMFFRKDIKNNCFYKSKYKKIKKIFKIVNKMIDSEVSRNIQNTILSSNIKS